MQLFNPMQCTGPGWGFEIMGGCSMAWFSFAIIVFGWLIAKRQAEDGMLSGTGFNSIGALVGGIGGNLILTILFGDARWSLLAGIIGLLAGGYLLGFFLGGDED